MKILLRSQTADGALQGDQWLNVPTLRIGRDAAQDIVLADFHVALKHAEINLKPAFLGLGSTLRIESRSKLPVYVNGVPVHGADLSLGDEIRLGRFSLQVAKPQASADGTLVLKESYEAHDERDAQKAGLKTTLRAAGWSRRSMAWLLFIVVLIPALLIPVFLHLQTLEAAPPEAQKVDREYRAQKVMGWDIAWNSGPMSSAHKQLANDCSVCHQQPFQQVTDASCKGCHAEVGEHAATVVTLQHSTFADLNCTDCHREHNGGGGAAGASSGHGIIPLQNQSCTDCHAAPEGLPGKQVLAVSTWSKDHPQFSIQLARYDANKSAFVWKEFRQGTADALRQDTGIKYPHDIHLDPKGIDAPGGRKVLECADCHQLADDGVQFKPIAMEPHCGECHRLDFDPAAKARELPHGKPAEVVQVVRDHYARVALAGGVTEKGAPAIVTSRRAPGQSLSPALAKAALQWADARADVALRDVFERRTCNYCHEVTKQSGDATAPWQIAPVAPVQRTMNSSVFPHQAHATETCESCHDVSKSKKSEDVHLPKIEQCRDCHGDTGAMTEVEAACQTCHVYHLNDLTPAGSSSNSAKPTLPAAHPAIPAAKPSSELDTVKPSALPEQKS